MIGLYDRDFVENPVEAFYNLELMKIASYYKSKNEMVSLITDLSRARYYSKIIYRQEAMHLPFPSDIYKYSNIELGGYSIEGKHLALPPEIDKYEPDTSIYDTEWNKIPKKNKRQTIMHKHYSTGAHIQLAYDDRRLRRPEIYLHGPAPVVVVHDTRIPRLEGAKEYLLGFKEQNPRTILMFRQQVIIEDFDFLYAASSFNTFTRYGCNIFYGPITDAQFRMLYRSAPKTFLETLFFAHGNFDSYTNKIEEDLITITKRCLYAKAFYLPYEIIYIQKISNPYINTIYNFLAKWAQKDRKNNYSKKRMPFYAFLEQQRFFKNSEYVEAYDFIIARIPQLKLLFKIDPQIIADNGGIMPL